MKGSPPKTPLEKVKKRRDSTGEESSPDIMVARKCDVLLATSSTGVVKKQAAVSSSKKSFLDNLLDSALATELSAEEKKIVEECRTTMPANATGLTVKKRLNQAKKRNATSAKKKGVAKSKAKKPAKVLAKHLGNNMSKAKTGSSGATGDVNEAVKKQVKKKRNKKQQRKEQNERMNTTSTVKTNKDNKKKHDEEPAQESQEINKKRTAVACWSQEDLGTLPRSKARHVITSRAYHQALTIHSVKKKDESKMTAEEIEAQNTKARELARAAGKGAEFDKKRPKEQEEKKKTVVDVD